MKIFLTLLSLNIQMLIIKLCLSVKDNAALYAGGSGAIAWLIAFEHTIRGLLGVFTLYIAFGVAILTLILKVIEMYKTIKKNN